MRSVDEKGPIFERKSPKQARARNTREFIFEAAARIIEEQGAFNTNAIAARAGISIGTLYGHFASKEAILVAMARKLLADDEAEVVRAVCEVDRIESSPVPAAVRTLISLHRSRPLVRRMVMNAHASHGLSHERSAVLHGAAQRILIRREQVLRRRVDGFAMFFATRALVGAIGAAFEEASPLLDASQFEDKLTTLVERCFLPADGDLSVLVSARREGSASPST